MVSHYSYIFTQCQLVIYSKTKFFKYISYKHFLILQIFVVDETTEDEKQSAVFITTFETVTENNQTTIKTKNKKLTQKNDFVVEEVLSEEDAEPSATGPPISKGDVQIVEVFDDVGKRFFFLTLLCFNFLYLNLSKHLFEIDLYFDKGNDIMEKET